MADARAVVELLRGDFAGEVITPADAGYDAARRVWNGLIDRYPAVIAKCASTDDVVTAVAAAREHGIEVAIRGGGHQIAGTGVCDDGLVIDLSPMNAVEVDSEERTARVGGGARWADVDRATQEVGLATTGGEISITGVGGLTLGGGMGLLQRAFGLACDNLRSIEIVTADGVVRTASPTENADLFWAARGAGRGLGVVTSFEFGLHALGPAVAAATAIYSGADARAVARAWRDQALEAPETVSPELLLWAVPPDPEIPAELHGQPCAIVVGVYAGDPADAGPVLEPLGNLGAPLIDAGGTMPYADLQSGDDALFPEGNRYYFKSHFANELTDEAIDELVGLWEGSPEAAHTLVAVRTLGGAIDRVIPEESAYPHRGARFNVSFDAGWTDPLDDTSRLAWARGAWTAFEPYATGGVYMNFAGFEDEADVSETQTFGPQARLDEVRAAYDPQGVFAAAAHRL